MSTTCAPPIPSDIAKVTGPILLGNLFNWGLFGVLGVQVYVYYLSFPKDNLFPKALVYSIFLIELVQVILVTRDAFRVFGFGFGNMILLDDIALIGYSIPCMTGIISCIVQVFFSWRIRIFSKTIWLPALIVLLALVQGVAGVWTGINAHLIGKFSEIQNHNYVQTSVWLGGTALVDTIITGTMTYYLARSRTGFRITNAMVTRFIRLTVETGFICAAFAILDLAFFLAFKEDNYHLVPATCLSKLYSNSLLVLLNVRARTTGGRNDTPSVVDTSLSGSSRFGFNRETPSNGQLSSGPSNRHRGERPIHVAVTHETTGDIEMDDSPKMRPGQFIDLKRDNDNLGT